MMPAFGVVAAVCLVVNGRRFELFRLEPADGEHNLERHIALSSFDEPVAMKVLVEPFFDSRDLIRVDQVDLVQDQQVE